MPKSGYLNDKILELNFYSSYNSECDVVFQVRHKLQKKALESPFLIQDPQFHILAKTDA